MTNSKPHKSIYKRVILKLSGEVLQSPDHKLSIDPEVLSTLAQRIKRIKAMSVQIGIVVGGGNIFRGISGHVQGIDRNSGDYMGMLATIINAMAIQDALEKAGVDTRVQTAIEMKQVAEPFIRRRAIRHLEKGRVVIFAGGTGNPYFTTDSAAALRANEISADLLIKATKVDGIYSDDPGKNPKARLLKTITYTKALASNLKVMDSAAFSLCMENNIPIIVLNFFKAGAMEQALTGKKTGTIVSDN